MLMEAIETTSASMPIVDEDMLDAGGVMITRAEIENPSDFLETERGKKWIGKLKDNAYYTRWYDHNRSPQEMKWCTELADKILDLKRNGACPGEVEDMLEEQFSGGQSAEECYEEDHEADTTKALEAISEALDEMREDDDTIPEMDMEDWHQNVRDLIVDHMYEQDDSSVMDMFGSYDRCEIVVRLHPGDDVYSQGYSCEFDRLSVNADLQAALASMGYTIGDYRRMSGNKEKGHRLRRVRRRAQPIVNEAELRELVSEACSSYFSFVLYAMVPVKDLVALDLSRPFSLSNYSIATYNASSGTFYEISRKDPITIEPGEGELMAPWGYSPDSICGFYHPPFHADITNVD